MHREAVREVVDEGALSTTRIAQQHQPALRDGGLDRARRTRALVGVGSPLRPASLQLRNR
ncbi:MAG: hypothetical protein ACRDGJ_10350 [Candidatus Limnocylindria bacterium]